VSEFSKARPLRQSRMRGDRSTMTNEEIPKEIRANLRWEAKSKKPGFLWGNRAFSGKLKDTSSPWFTS
jgi:hypothetical protein